MNTLKRFYIDIKNTFYNPKFYSKITKVGLLHPFWIIFKLSVVSSLIVLVLVLPTGIAFIKDVQNITESEYFPSELEIVINDGVATSNLTEEPYYIKSDVINSEFLGDEAKNVVAISTKEDLTFEEIENEDAIFFLTKTAFVFKDEGELRVFRYSQIFSEEVVINQQNVERIVNRVVEKLPLIFTLLSIFALIFLTIASVALWLIFAFLLSLITFTINKIRNLGLSYKNVFKLSMYALVPAIVIDILTDILFGLDSFSFLLTATIFTVVLVWNTKSNELTVDKTSIKND